jgi:hypothetical protein
LILMAIAQQQLCFCSFFLCHGLGFRPAIPSACPRFCLAALTAFSR